MHIPDGFLDAKTVVATATLAAIGVGIAVRRAQTHLPPRRVPLLGLTAAFVFAAQMVNFPVAGGTSGHSGRRRPRRGAGGTERSGGRHLDRADRPVSHLRRRRRRWPLGANVFNMGIVGGGGRVGHLPRGVSCAGTGSRPCSPRSPSPRGAGGPSRHHLAAGELSLSGVVPWSVALPAMAGMHMLIGVGEAAHHDPGHPRPSCERVRNCSPRETGRCRCAGSAKSWPSELLIALGIAMFVSPLASAWPDGLGRWPQSLGFAERSVKHRSFHRRYRTTTMPGIVSSTWATALAGGVGNGRRLLPRLALARVLVGRRPGRGRRPAGTLGHCHAPRLHGSPQLGSTARSIACRPALKLAVALALVTSSCCSPAAVLARSLGGIAAVPVAVAGLESHPAALPPVAAACPGTAGAGGGGPGHPAAAGWTHLPDHARQEHALPAHHDPALEHHGLLGPAPRCCSARECRACSSAPWPSCTGTCSC